MSFAGWSLAQLAPLLAIGGVGITALYLLRMRRRQVEVPFAALWVQVTRQADSRRLWKRLRRILSWLLQLLLWGLVCLALGDPRPEDWLADPATIAIVVDRSASMAGTEDGTIDGPRRIDRARARAVAVVDAMGPNDRAAVIAAGQVVSVVAPRTRDHATLREAIAAIEPSYGEADLEHALGLASHLVRDAPGPRVVVQTDGAVSDRAAMSLRSCVEGPIPCRVEWSAGVARNVAVTAFAARRDPSQPDKVEVLAEVHNFSDRPVVVRLDVEADDAPLGRRDLELAPGESRREVLPRLDAARTRMVARLTSEDPAVLGPSFDDVAYAVVPPLRPLDVVVVSDGTNLFLDAALLTLADHVRLRGMSAIDAASRASDAAYGDADLVIYDVGAGALPTELPEANVVLFDPWRQSASPCPIAKRSDVARPFLTERDERHPILDNVILKDVNIARGTTFAVEPSDTVLVRSLGEPIVVLRETTRLVLAVGFDLRQSDLALRTAFPLMIDNLVDYVARRAPGFVATYAVGEGQRVRLADLGLPPQAVRRVEIDDPLGRSTSTPVEDGDFLFRPLTPGIYGVRVPDDRVATEVWIAANQLDRRACDPAPRIEAALGPPMNSGDVDLRASPPEPPPPSPFPWGPPWALLIGLVAIALAVEWVTYHRRVTV